MSYRDPEMQRAWQVGYDAGRRADKVSAARIRNLERRIQELEASTPALVPPPKPTPAPVPPPAPRPRSTVAPESVVDSPRPRSTVAPEPPTITDLPEGAYVDKYDNGVQRVMLRVKDQKDRPMNVWLPFRNSKFNAFTQLVFEEGPKIPW